MNLPQARVPIHRLVGACPCDAMRPVFLIMITLPPDDKATSQKRKKREEGGTEKEFQKEEKKIDGAGYKKTHFTIVRLARIFLTSG